MKEKTKTSRQTRSAFVCRPTPKPDATERRKNLRQGDQLVVNGSQSSFVLEVSSPESRHPEQDRS